MRYTEVYFFGAVTIEYMTKQVQGTHLISIEAIHHYSECLIQEMVFYFMIETGWHNILVSAPNNGAFPLRLHIRVRYLTESAMNMESWIDFERIICD